MTDTPVATPTYPPPSTADQIKSMVGDLARPYALYAVATAVSIAIIKIAWEITDGNIGAVFLTAAGGLLAAMYGAKSLEVAAQAKQQATVDVARAQAPTPAS
jgi:hypothetical protein